MNKYFVWHEEEGEYQTFATQKEQEQAVEKIIDWYKDAGEWPESDVMCSIVSGIITHKVQQTDYEECPDDLDEDGKDKNGKFWEDNWEYMCNYKSMEV